MTDREVDDKPRTPKVSVVVVAYRSGATLESCLERLFAQSEPGFEVILVDNASPDREAQACAARWPQIRLIENQDNLGFAAAVNQGARAGRAPWMALLNPDAFPARDWLEALLDAARRHPEVRSFTARQLMDDDPKILDGLGDVMSGPCVPYRGGYMCPDPGDTAEGFVFSPCGAAMMVDRALFLELGGFDETFFCYCEDVDFGYRLQLAGEPTLVVPEAVIRHVGSASSGGPKSDFAVFHGVRNRFWVLVKDTPWPLLPIVLPAHIAAVIAIALRPAGRPLIPITLKAYRAALKDLPLALAGRRRAQGMRKAPFWKIAAAMTWNPRDLTGRRPVIRRISPSR